MKPNVWRAMVVAFCTLFASSLIARAPTEYEIKAAFLFNFSKFVDWPPKAFANDTDPMVIGIIGEDPFGETLAQLVKNQTAQGRNIEIRHYKAGEDCGGCHLLFLSRSVADDTAEILSRIKDRPIVTVSEKENFVRQGGIIGFVLLENSVRFDINNATAEKAGLKASSKLLAVARTVVNTS